MGNSFRLAARVLLYASSHSQDDTYHGLCYTSRGPLAGTRNSSMGPSWRIDPMTHRTMSERSYHGATSRSRVFKGLMGRCNATTPSSLLLTSNNLETKTNLLSLSDSPEFEVCTISSKISRNKEITRASQVSSTHLVINSQLKWVVHSMHFLCLFFCLTTHSTHFYKQLYRRGNIFMGKTKTIVAWY